MLTAEILFTALVTICIGLVAIFYGYQLFRILLIAGGFGLGVLIAQNLFVGDSQTKLIVSLIAGLVLAVLANFIYNIGFVLLAGILSASLAYVLISQSAGLTTSNVILIVGAGLAGSILTLALGLEHLIIVLATCAYGIVLVGSGILRIIYNGNIPELSQLPVTTLLVLLVLTAILVSLGIGRQLKKVKE